MFTVMRDPVILPSSRTTIDRSTIKSHLLSDSKDPFNRVPLKIEEVIPSEPKSFIDVRAMLSHQLFSSDTELKLEIENFLVERRKQALLDKDVEMST
jgi:ubiquitin conjugation factor E4 B